jgi:hypothetical protein
LGCRVSCGRTSTRFSSRRLRRPKSQNTRQRGRLGGTRFFSFDGAWYLSSPFLKRKGGDPEITAFPMSVTSLSANPFYEAQALAARILKQDKEMVGVIYGQPSRRAEAGLRSCHPCQLSVGPNPGPYNRGLGIGTSIIRRWLGVGFSLWAPGRSTRLLGCSIRDTGSRRRGSGGCSRGRPRQHQSRFSALRAHYQSPQSGQRRQQSRHGRQGRFPGRYPSRRQVEPAARASRCAMTSSAPCEYFWKPTIKICALPQAATGSGRKHYRESRCHEACDGMHDHLRAIPVIAGRVHR